MKYITGEKRSIFRRIICCFLLIFFGGCIPLNQMQVNASAVSLETLPESAMYHTEQQISGYKNVEKTGYREVEKTGYKEVEVEKVGSREVTKYKSEQVAKQVPYSVDVPIFNWVVTEYYAKKGTVIYRAPKINMGYDIEVRTNNKWYTSATTDSEIKLTKINEDWGQANNVLYTTYADVPTFKYYSSTKQSTQVYLSPNISKKLTATNSNGKKYNVLISSNKNVTKYNAYWYKANISYLDYRKVKYKWQKVIKNATIYIPLKDVKTTGSKLYVWTKQTKKVNGYFYLNTGEIRKTSEWKKVATNKETRFKTGTETVQVPYTETEQYTYKEIERQPYQYKVSEPYTYIDKEPIYKTIKAENTSQEKYKAIINYYWQYRLTETELFQLLNQVGLEYDVLYGYDKSRIVYGVVTVNGTTSSYSFTPNTRVKLIVFKDSTAVNLSYLFTVFGKNYDDIKINSGSYTTE